MVINSSQRNWPSYVFNGLLPLGFALLDVVLMPLSAFQFDPDEGLNLATAMMYGQGYDLYGDILNDQPPLFTIALNALLKLSDALGGEKHQVLIGRLGVLLFAIALVWMFAQIIRLTIGDRAAIVATIGLIFSCNFLRLSLSIMIGLPSLTLAMLAVYCWVLMEQTREELPRWLLKLLPLISGLALAASLTIKMFTIFFVPLLAGFWFWRGWSNSPKLAIRRGALFVLGTLGGFIVINLACGSLDNINDFLGFHVGSSLKQEFEGGSSLGQVFVFYLQDVDYVFVGLWGLGLICWQKKYPTALFPLAWLALVTVLLSHHKPLWYHHYLLLSIPICWLGAIGFEGLLAKLKEQRHTHQQFMRQLITPAGLTVSFLGVAFMIKGYFFYDNNQLFLRQTAEANVVLTQVVQHAPRTEWLFTDLPMYAARSRLNIPPELARISLKRIRSGQVTPESAIALVERYQPEQFLLGRFPELSEPLRPYLKNRNFTETIYGKMAHLVSQERRIP